MNRWADRVARTWTATYTRGLEAEARDRRRLEILSDLHEHGALDPSHRQQFDVVRRVVSGVPADLGWRLGQRRHRLEPSARPVMRGLAALVVMLAATFDVASIPGALAAVGGGPRYAAVLVAVASASILGLVARRAAPLPSTILLVGSAAVRAVAFPWMAVVFVPLLLVTTVLAVATQPPDVRRRSDPAAVQ